MIFIDPDGKEVRALNKEAENLLILQVKPEEAKYIKFNKNGFINKRRINRGLKKLGENAGGNFKSLVQVVNKDIIFEYTVSEQYAYRNESLEYKEKKFKGKESVLPEMYTWPGVKEGYATFEEFEKKMIWMHGKENLYQVKIGGITFVPFTQYSKETSKSKMFSTNSSVQIYINPHAKEVDQVKSVAHETRAHGLRFVNQQSYEHGTAMPGMDGYEKDLEVEAMYSEVEAEENYKLHKNESVPKE